MPNIYVRGKTVATYVKSSNKKIFVEVNNSNNPKTRIRNMAFIASKNSNDIKVNKKYEEEDEKWLNTKVYEATEKGKAEGISESKSEIAKNMLEMDLDLETISKAIGLSIEEIEKLL